MSADHVPVRMVPAVKLWADHDDLCEHERTRGSSYVIVLECQCGDAVDYPGHPDERELVQCPTCRTIWTLESVSHERIVAAAMGRPT